MGVTEEAALGFPGYTGRIPPSAAMLARVLRDSGYNTMRQGVRTRRRSRSTRPPDRSTGGPSAWASNGSTASSAPRPASGRRSWCATTPNVEAPRTPEEGYHLTEDLVDEAIRMVQDQQQAEARKPFFLHLATGVPPMHPTRSPRNGSGPTRASSTTCGGRR